METTKVIFKIIDDEVIAIFPNNIYNKQLYGKTIVNSYMHIEQHSACSVELMDELPYASQEQYKDLKNELEEIGYNLELVDRTIEFMHDNTTHIFNIDIQDADFWISVDGYDIYYCEDDNEICVYKENDTNKTIYSETIKN